MIYRKIAERRSIRRYIGQEVPREVLVKCLDAARLSPSGANRQPLKYVVINDEELLKEVFTTLSWAGYLPDYQPSTEEMPMAYIIILLDKNIRKDPGHDAGIAAMSISMVAHDEGLGSCMLGAIDRRELRKILRIPNNLDIILAIALGYSAENPKVERLKNEDVRYWLDKDKVLHVPKRKLEDIVKWNGYHTRTSS